MIQPLTLTTLSGLIRDAARTWFSAIRRKHPDETFYAFALYTDDDASAVCHAANSEEGYNRKLCMARQRGDAIPPADILHYRWCPSEWAYEDGTTGYPPLNAFDLERFREQEAQNEHDCFFRLKLCRAMTQGLALLDEEGFFGNGAERCKVTIFVTITDSVSSDGIEAASVHALNPEITSKKFFDDLVVRFRLA